MSAMSSRLSPQVLHENCANDDEEGEQAQQIEPGPLFSRHPGNCNERLVGCEQPERDAEGTEKAVARPPPEAMKKESSDAVPHCDHAPGEVSHELSLSRGGCILVLRGFSRRPR